MQKTCPHSKLNLASISIYLGAFKTAGPRAPTLELKDQSSGREAQRSVFLDPPQMTLTQYLEALVYIWGLVKITDCRVTLLWILILLVSKRVPGASLVAQWLRICLPMQGTRVRVLVWEDPTCHGATRPVSHNY